jgi:hypothetical protein
MNAFDWLKSKTQKKSSLYWLIFLSLFPLIAHIVGRIVKQKWWLNDFDALICGADYLRRGLSPYEVKPFCDGLLAPPYVYAPQVAEFWVPIINSFGLIGTKAIYMIFIIPVMGVILWYALRKTFADLALRWRIIGFCVLSGSALSCGNIIFVFHALAIVCGLRLAKTRWPFLLVVLAGSLIKPVFLTYLIVFIYQNKPFMSRISVALIGAVLGLAGYAYIISTAGPYYAEWQQLVDRIVLKEQPGYGFFGWVAVIGLEATHPISLIGFGLYFVALAMGGFILVEVASLDDDRRLLLGLGMAQLLNPRLMAYDMLYLPVFAAVVIMLAVPLGERFFNRVTWAYLSVCGVGFFLAALDIIKPASMAALAFAALTLTIAYQMARSHIEALISQLMTRRAWLGQDK